MEYNFFPGNLVLWNEYYVDLLRLCIIFWFFKYNFQNLFQNYFNFSTLQGISGCSRFSRLTSTAFPWSIFLESRINFDKSIKFMKLKCHITHNNSLQSVPVILAFVQLLNHIFKIWGNPSTAFTADRLFALWYVSMIIVLHRLRCFRNSQYICNWVYIVERLRNWEVAENI